MEKEIKKMPDNESHLSRISVQKMDDILGDEFPVLDDGFIRVIDYMGSDESIVQAARVSYGKGTKKLHQDRGLIRYLMRNRHTSPFEMCEIKLHVRVPIYAWRQWIRHRTASVNEVSMRYSVAIDATQRTEPGAWRSQATENRQGSGPALDLEVGERLSLQEDEVHALTRRVYQERLEAGVAREQARKDLTLSMYTEAYWKIDLHNLLHFLSLRMDKHAQQEIRAYADVIGQKILKIWCPLTWEAFVDYRIGGESFSRGEMEVIRAIVRGDLKKARDGIAIHKLSKGREGRRFFKKLGITIFGGEGDGGDGGEI
jgi:thymidylate synthase (FAD)